MNYRFIVMCIVLLTSNLSMIVAQGDVGAFQLISGDLLFQDSDCGPFCDAIEKVTVGYQGSNLSHVGIVSVEENGVFVLEAGGNGVVTTTLDAFLSRSCDSQGNPKVIVGRLKSDYEEIIPTAISYAKRQLGAAYDDLFEIANETYYCSELVYEAFEVANHGTEVFSLEPMTFIDPSTQEYFGIWVDYFQDLNADIPQGELGLNPGGISRSEKINIVYKFGFPDNMMEY